MQIRLQGHCVSYFLMKIGVQSNSRRIAEENINLKMEIIMKKTENIQVIKPAFNTQYGIVLEENASFLTQGQYGGCMESKDFGVRINPPK